MRNQTVQLLIGPTLLISVPLPAQRPDTLRLPLAWEITENNAAVAESLGVLSGIAIDRAGNVYVSDRGATKVWVFDAQGRSQRGIGRKGQGPGEFTSPTGLAIGPDGRLWVRDISRVTRFKTDPATGRLGAYESTFPGPTYADWMSTRASRFTASGGFAYPEFGVGYRVFPPPRLGRWFIYQADGTLTDSVDVPYIETQVATTARVMISANSGRMINGLNHVPFYALPVYDLTPRGTVLVGDGRAYLIRELDRDGKVLREYKRTVAPDRIPAAERRDSTAALKARIDSLTYPRDQVQGVPADVWALRLPET